MDFLQKLDIQLFRRINQELSSPLLDQVMPFLSGNAFFIPAVVLACGLVIWKGGRRGLLMVLMLLAAVAIADGVVSRSLKELVGRPRPFLTLTDVNLLLGRGNSASMPSSHAANWFAAAMVIFIYYRRWAWLAVFGGALVSLSRIYNGVHYPSDVLAGAVLGAGTGAAVVFLCNAAWNFAGRRWFPLWWRKLPHLGNPQAASAEGEEEPEFAPRGSSAADLRPRHADIDQHWVRLGYLFIAVLLLARWAYIASGTIHLSEDEAYQWLWSKHLDISYYSKPPLIAYTQWLGTSLWGDTAFGIRFFSPLISAVLAVMVLRFFAREVNARAGFLLLAVLTATPILSAGSVLMTVDPLSVLCWSAAMFAGWRAVQEKGTTADWLWVGVWMALGFLSKYTQLFQLLCWAVFFVLWKPARKRLRQPGPYLALMLNLAGTIPVIIWNAGHDWITVTHVAESGGAGKTWTPTLKYFAEFLGTELGLLNPVFLVAAAWAAVAFWKKNRNNPRLVYFFSMGAPVVLIYSLQSFNSRVLPNWIIPAVLPLFILATLYWEPRLRLGNRTVKGWLTTGLVLGFAAVVTFHDTDLLKKLTGRYVPAQFDVLRRVRGWEQTARLVSAARESVLQEGKPVFIIADHYGVAGELSFYMPEAKAALKGEPLVYCKPDPVPKNQFYFWPSYSHREGQNAIYVRKLDPVNPKLSPLPNQVATRFETIIDKGVTKVMHRNSVPVRGLHIFECRNLRPPDATNSTPADAR